MKSKIRKLLPGILFIFIPVLSSGQAFDGGAILGLSLNQIDGDSRAGYDKPGLVAGAFARTDNNNMLNFQIEISYFSKGASSGIIKDVYQENYYRLRLRYIQVPVTGQISINDRMKAELGPSFGYLMGAAEDDGNGYVPAQISFRDFEFSGLLGFTYLLNDNIGLNARFCYSIIPIYEDPGEQVYYLERDLYNNSLVFGVYYTIF